MLKVSILLASFSFFLFSCKNRKQSATSSKPEKSIVTEDTLPVDRAHNSQNALDWQGDYKGILPCADCDGIKTTLSLESGTYTLSSTYLGKTNATNQTSGNITWSKDGSTIMLTDTTSTASPIQYKVDENRLILLNSDGKTIQSALADKYILTKQN